MSSKKRKGDFCENTAAETAQKTSRNTDSSHTEPDMNGHGDKCESDQTTLREQLEEALLKIEQLDSAPCTHCNLYSNWSVRVRTMSGGQVHTIACPDGPKTLVAHVKQKLAQFDPKFHIMQQVKLVLPCEASSSSSSADANDPVLADDRNLASYGLSNRDVIELFLVDMNWSTECQKLIDFIKDGGEEIQFTHEMQLDKDDSALAVSMALVNAVCWCGCRAYDKLVYT